MKMRMWNLMWRWLLVVSLLSISAVAPDIALSACGLDPPLPPEGLSWPVAGEVINGWSLDCGSDRGHRGIDIATTAGTAIFSTAPGIVTYVGYTPAEGGGQTVSVTHFGGLRSTYLHLEDIQVSQGDSVNSSQPLGVSAGSFVHFGLKLEEDRARYFDPSIYLPLPEDPVIPAPGNETAATNNDQETAGAAVTAAPSLELPAPVPDASETQPAAPGSTAPSPEPAVSLTPHAAAADPVAELDANPVYDTAASPEIAATDTAHAGSSAAIHYDAAEDMPDAAAENLPAAIPAATDEPMLAGDTVEATEIQPATGPRTAGVFNAEASITSVAPAVGQDASPDAHNKYPAASAGMRHNVSHNDPARLPGNRLSVYPVVLALLTALGLAGQRYDGPVPRVAYV